MDFDPLWILPTISARSSLFETCTPIPIRNDYHSKLLVFLFDSPSFSSPIGRKGSEFWIFAKKGNGRRVETSSIFLILQERNSSFFLLIRVLVRGTTSGAIITLVNELALHNEPINTLPSNEKTSTGSLIIQSSLFPFSFTSIGRDHLR